MKKRNKAERAEIEKNRADLNFNYDLETFSVDPLEEKNVEDFMLESSKYDEVVSDIFVKAFKDYFLNLPDEIKFKMFEYIFSDMKKFDELYSKIWNEAYDYAMDYYFENYFADYGNPSKNAILLFVKKIREGQEEFRNQFWSLLLTKPEYLEEVKKFFENEKNKKNAELSLKENFKRKKDR